MATTDKGPVLVFDLAGYSSLTSAQVTAAMDRLVEVLDAAVRPLFGPMADPWASLRRWNTGDGYYVLLRGLGAHAGLLIARKIDEQLSAGEVSDADHLIRLRIVLGWGAVEEIGDRFEGAVLTEMGRLLDGSVLRQALTDGDGKTVLAVTPEFRGAWGQDSFRHHEDLKVDPVEWFEYSDQGKRGEVWPGYLFGQPPAEQVAPAEIPVSTEPVRIVAFVAHSLAEPLPAALEWAQVLANRIMGSGLNIELRLAPAARVDIVEELSKLPEIAIFYGHGDERGRLLLNDGLTGLGDLQPDLWRQLKGCILFACDSVRFAAELECPYVAFDQKILQNAPVGFVEALLQSWPSESFGDAVDQAFALCTEVMASEFPEAGVRSAAGFGALAVEPGTPVLARGTPKQFGWVWTDYGEIQDGPVTYPEHEPFVGRRALLTALLRRIPPFGDADRVQAHWITGTGGVGKTALTRELALTTAEGLFVESAEPLWVHQMNCYAFTDAGSVLRSFAGRLAVRHGLAESDDIDRIAADLAAQRGEHLWLLDDLTYLATKPDDTASARRLADTLVTAARRAGLLARIVVTSRRGDTTFTRYHALGPLEWLAAAEMAQRMAWVSGRKLTSEDLELGARRLHTVSKGMPALYKRSLKQALESCGYRAHADAMAASLGGSLEEMELDELARQMTAYEIEALGALEPMHGFAYQRYLGAAYDLFRRAGWFDAGELMGWFAVEPLAATREKYERGLLYLLRLGFLALELRGEQSVYILPPNQRQAMQARRDESFDLSHVPFRAPGQALSMALELARTVGLPAAGDFDELRRAYGGDLSNAGAAAAVIAAMNSEAEIRRLTTEDDPEPALDVYREILSTAEKYDNDWSSQPSALVAEQVAIGLVNMGITHGQQDRPDEALAAYARLADLYADCPEAAVAEQVARGLLNMGITHGQQDRPEEEIAGYARLADLYADRPEAAVAEQVAKGLVNMGITHGLQDRPDEAIAAFARLADLYAERPEAAIAEQVAMGLVYMGITHGRQDRPDEAIAAFARLVDLYAERPEAAIAERVARGLVNMGARLGQQDRPDEEIAAYSRLADLYAERPEAAIAERVARGLVNMGARLGQQDRPDEAIAAFARLADLYAERPEAAIAEQVAMGLVNMGARLGQQDRPDEAIAAFARLADLYAERPEAAIAERVARGLVNMGARLGQQDRPDEEIAAYSRLADLYAERPEAAIAEQVAMGLVNMGARLGQQDRPDEAIAAFARLVDLYAERPEVAVAEHVGRGLVGAAIVLRDAGQAQDAIERIDRLEALYGDRSEAPIVEVVALAAKLKSSILEQRDDN